MDMLTRKCGTTAGLWMISAFLLVLGGCKQSVEIARNLAKNPRGEAQLRGQVSRARTDMRSLAVAIEAYFVDNNTYPAYAIGLQSVNGALGAKVPASRLPSFRLPEPPTANQAGQSLRFQTLTTPIAYYTQYPNDSFVPGSKATFVYWSVQPGQPDPSGKIVGKDSPVKGVGWILVSPGPDGEYDMAGEWDSYDPSLPLGNSRLIDGTNKKGSALTYDPTNGTVSKGDIWRMKQ